MSSRVTSAPIEEAEGDVLILPEQSSPYAAAAACARVEAMVTDSNGPPASVTTRIRVERFQPDRLALTEGPKQADLTLPQAAEALCHRCQGTSCSGAPVGGAYRRRGGGGGRDDGK